MHSKAKQQCSDDDDKVGDGCPYKIEPLGQTGIFYQPLIDYESQSENLSAYFTKLVKKDNKMENGDIEFSNEDKEIEAMDELIENVKLKRTATILRIKDRIESEEQNMK